ncbi:MAG: sialidase family protein [Caldilineaceae bacterium]
MLTKTDIFTARTEGYWNYRVPGILCTGSGVILATVEARTGTGGDWDGNDILLRRSLDGGVSWLSPQRVVSHSEYGPGPVSNFVLFADKDGTVHALYCHNYERVFYLQSGDDGASFSAPVEITHSLTAFRAAYPWRVIATGPGHGIQLQNGRLLVPVWMSDGSGTEFGAGKLGHRPSEVGMIYSDDRGATWQCGEIFVHSDDQIVNPSETLAVELDDGRVLCNIRSESSRNRRLIATSPDGSSRWTQPVYDDALLEPVCMGSLLRLGQPNADGRGVYLFANPDNLENELTAPGRNLAHDRKRLTVKMSSDDCATWHVSRVLEEGPSGYSDLAEAPDGSILCIYERGMLSRMTDSASVAIARFDRAWLSVRETVRS